jgi:hypothetical protein
MQIRQSIKGERFIQLDWQGPFLLRDGTLRSHPVEPAEPPGPAAGLYVIVSDFPLRGSQTLAYIGETKDLKARLRQPDHKWLRWEWRLEVYVALVPNKKIREDAENLLIRAHAPPGNTQHIARGSKVTPPMRIWNYGRYWGLFPEVSSEHEWHRA